MTEPQAHHRLLVKDKAELLDLTKEELCKGLVELVFSGERPAESLQICLALSVHPNREVRGVVATCIGHLARLHRDLDLSQADSALTRISEDPKLKGRAEDAREDIRQFSIGKRI